MGTQYAIECNNLQFNWESSSPVLNIKQWSLASGTSLFLHGNSGSGKTTLLNIIAGILPATDGNITVLDTALKSLNQQQRDRFRANNIGFIFQQFNLIPYLSVAENIQLGAQFSKNQKQALTLHEMCERLQLESELLSRKATQLSIGQQQRVAVARALYNQPALIIADEPTSALDSDNRDKFIELLLTQSQQSNSTVLFVSHDRSLAHHFDDAITLGDVNHV